MRDPNRLYSVYNSIRTLHQEAFPDWRFTQFIDNFRSWLYTNKKIEDWWYIEDDKIIKYFSEFVQDIHN